MKWSNTGLSIRLEHKVHIGSQYCIFFIFLFFSFFNCSGICNPNNNLYYETPSLYLHSIFMKGSSPAKGYQAFHLNHHRYCYSVFATEQLSAIRVFTDSPHVDGPSLRGLCRRSGFRRQPIVYTTCYIYVSITRML